MTLRFFMAVRFAGGQMGLILPGGWGFFMCPIVGNSWPGLHELTPVERIDCGQGVLRTRLISLS
jgi:hypothetical protein